MNISSLEADVRVALGSVGGVDAAADAVVEKLIEYIKSNPPKSVSWKVGAPRSDASSRGSNVTPRLLQQSRGCLVERVRRRTRRGRETRAPLSARVSQQ